MQNVVIWAGLVGSLFGIGTSFVAVASLYRSSIRKGYAAERDFIHLQNDYKSLANNIDFLIKDIAKERADILKEIDTRSDRLQENQLEIKALLLANLGIKPKSLE